MANFELHKDCKILSLRVYPENRHQNSNGWTYRESYSNQKSGYYSEVYTKGEKVILVIRGTETKSGFNQTRKDVNNDISMGLQVLPFQMKDAEEAYLSVVRKYGKSNLVITGHSLGGSEAQILGAKYGVETVTFAAYGTANLRGVDNKYKGNIVNYGNAQDMVFVSNIDNQIGKTIILNSNIKSDYLTKSEQTIDKISLSPHKLENLGDLSKGIEYKKDVFEDEKAPLYKLGIEYDNYNPDDVFDIKNRVLYQGEINPKDLKRGTPLYDLYLDCIFDEKSLPTKKEVDKRTRIGELIYVEEYVRSDGTKVSGYYRAYPRK